MPEDQIFSGNESPVRKAEFGLGGILLGIVFVAVALLVLNYFNLINIPFNLPEQTAKINVKQNVQTTKDLTTKELVDIEKDIKPEIMQQLKLSVKEGSVVNMKHFTVRDPENNKKTIEFYLIKTKNATFSSSFVVRQINTEVVTKELRFFAFPWQKPDFNTRLYVFASEEPHVITNELMHFQLEGEFIKTASDKDINTYTKRVIPILKNILANNLDSEERLKFSNQIIEFLKTSSRLSIYDEDKSVIEFIKKRSQNESRAIDKIIDNL